MPLDINTLVRANQVAVGFHLVFTVGQIVLIVLDKVPWKYIITDNKVVDLENEEYEELNENFGNYDSNSSQYFSNIRNKMNKETKISTIPLGLAQLSFTVICVLAHTILLRLSKGGTASTYYRWIYEDQTNYLRWFEYFISSSIMMTNIGGLCGIRDVWKLSSIFALTAVTNMFGLMAERTESKLGKLGIFSLGFFPYIIPWLQINKKFNDSIKFFEKLLSKRKNDSNDDEMKNIEIPSFVKQLIPIMFSLFAIFPIIQLLQIIGLDYSIGELLYLLASLITKSVLTWIVFLGALRNDPPEYLGE